MPTRDAITPPVDIADENDGYVSPGGKPILAMSPARRLISAGEPAPSTITRSAPADTCSKLSMTSRGPWLESLVVPPLAWPATLPWTTIWLPTSDCGFRSTGFICTEDGTVRQAPGAIAQRPISPAVVSNGGIVRHVLGLERFLR
ncbi:hypothetical protein F2981_16160 [Sinorhizobium meliloti]|nr:hypothetical protein [Sinorhizobium meliloti]